MIVTVTLSTLVSSVLASLGVGLLVERLKKERELQESICNHGSIGILVVDRELTVVYMNRAMEKMLGRSSGEVVGRLKCHELCRCSVPPPAAPPGECGGQRALGGETVTNVELSCRDRYGHTLQVLASYSLVPSTAAGRARVIMMMRDITEKKKREAELETLTKATVDISSLNNIEDILGFLLGKSRQLIGCEAAFLGLLDSRGECLEIVRSEGIEPRAIEELGIIRLDRGDPLLQEAVGSSQAMVVKESLEGTVWSRMGISSCLLFPLNASGQVLGLMVLGARGSRRFNLEDLGVGSCLANLAALAIQNSRLYRQVEGEAILEERHRIAREIHDGLAQVLGFLLFKTRLARRFVESGKGDRALIEIDQMEQAVSDSQEDLRQSIYGLRLATRPGTEWVDLLREYALQFGELNGVEVGFVAKMEGKGGLPIRTQLELMRILQEALANVRKDARARRVDVLLSEEGESYILSICDDGCGFPLNTGRKPEGRRSFGLSSMRERAEKIGGNPHFSLHGR